MENTMINYKRFTPYPNKREILNIPVAFHVNYHAKIQNIPDCLSQNQIQQFYLDFFKKNKNKVAYKDSQSTRNKTFFQNTGNAIVRHEAMLAVKETLAGQGINMVLDIAYNDSPGTGIFIGGSWEIPDPKKEGAKIKHSIVLKKGSGSTSGGNIATQFEGNVLVGVWSSSLISFVSRFCSSSNKSSTS